MGGLSVLAWLTTASELDRDQAERDPDPRAEVRNPKFVLGYQTSFPTVKRRESPLLAGLRSSGAPDRCPFFPRQATYEKECRCSGVYDACFERALSD
jgi:hypothetical protein